MESLKKVLSPVWKWAKSKGPVVSLLTDIDNQKQDCKQQQSYLFVSMHQLHHLATPPLLRPMYSQGQFIFPIIMTFKQSFCSP